jgi:hypothetical protein
VLVELRLVEKCYKTVLDVLEGAAVTARERGPVPEAGRTQSVYMAVLCCAIAGPSRCDIPARGTRSRSKSAATKPLTQSAPMKRGAS